MNPEIEPSIKIVYEAHELFNDIKQGYKEENLQKLVDIRERMLMAGFDAPFKALLKRTHAEGDEEERSDEIEDLKKQVKQFRYMAMLKKSALKRAITGISAHRLAAAFLKTGYGDILEFLPFDGNYIENLFKTGPDGVKTYRKLIDELEASGKELPVYLVTVLYKGGKYKVKIKNKTELDQRIAREFGPDAAVVNVRTSTREVPLIRSKSVRVSLVSAIVAYVSEDEKDRKELLRKSTGLLLSPIFKFYLLNSEEERKKNNLYPTLAQVPNEGQLEVFSNLKALDPELKNASRIIAGKLEAEKKYPGIKNRLLGPALLFKSVKKDKEWVCRYLGATKEELEQGIKYLEGFEKGGRGAGFLEKLKKG